MDKKQLDAIKARHAAIKHPPNKTTTTNDGNRDLIQLYSGKAYVGEIVDDDFETSEWFATAHRDQGDLIAELERVKANYATVIAPLEEEVQFRSRTYPNRVRELLVNLLANLRGLS